MKTTRLALVLMTLFAADTLAGTQEQLAAYRQQIDSLDRRIIELFQQRARVVEEVRYIKREAHLPVTVPGREQEVIEKAQEFAKAGPLPPEAVGRIYQKVVEEMRNWEARLDPAGHEGKIRVEQVLQTMQSWDGQNYQGYPTGQPQLTVLRITIPPNTALHWHHHPVISVGYVLSGHLTIEKRDTGERTTIPAGQTVAETVQTTHRGFTTDEPAELVVFYAGQVGLPITINEE